jgi:hypothetical protein
MFQFIKILKRIRIQQKAWIRIEIKMLPLTQIEVREVLLEERPSVEGPCQARGVSIHASVLDSPLLYNITVLRIRIRIQIHRIHMFLGLLDPAPLVRGMDPDPDPSITKQK